MNPYLSFRDGALTAMEFYRSVFGGELTSSAYADFGMSDDPADADKTMHSQLLTTEGWVLMAADLPASLEHTPSQAVSVSLSGGPDEQDKLTGWYDRLAEDGQVLQPLEQAPWGDSFGACIDRFGTSWMVNIGGSTPPE